SFLVRKVFLSMRSRMKIQLRRKGASGVVLLVTLVTLALPSAVLGQGAGASIEGYVRDQQGAVLPGATVTLRNEETGVSRATTTEADGQYRFLALGPGRYRLTAEMA